MYLLDPEILQAMEGRVVRPVRLIFIDWPGGAVYAHTGRGDIVFQGKTWLGVGSFGSVSDLELNDNVGAHTVNLGISGIDPKTLTEVVTQNVINREVELYYGVLDEDWQLIGAHPYFYGRVSGTSITRYQDDAIAVQATSKTADWAKSRYERYTYESFISVNPGDDFCQYVDQMAEREISFGGSSATVPLVPREQQS